MKTGRPLPEFALELKRQADSKRDFIAPADMLTIETDGKIIIDKIGGFDMTENYESQTAGWLEYPYAFWKRSRQAHPAEWLAMTNAMLHASHEPRMVRTLNGQARGFLSKSYRRIDNWDVADTILNAVTDMSGWTVDSAEITDSRMYLKVLTPLRMDVQIGDEVQAGFIVRNSEIGLGSYEVEYLIYRLRCKNGMIRPDFGLRKNHLGANVFERGLVNELLSDNTKRLTDAALMAQTADVIRATMNRDQFSRVVNQFQASIGQPITGDVPKVVEVTAKNYGLTEFERKSVLRSLIDQGDGLNRYGLINAITATAQAGELSYERGVELEEIGGKVLELNPRDWEKLSSVN